MRRRNRDAAGLTLAVFAIQFAILAFFVNLARLLFQYSLWCITARDIPWYGDIAGGLVCNGFLVPASVACWIARLCGYDAPFLHA